MAGSSQYKFRANIISELYYSPDTQWGVYMFETQDDIPELFQTSKQLFDESLTIVNAQKLVGKMQRLYLGAEYIIDANLEYSKRYNEKQYVANTITAVVPKESKESLLFLCTLTNNEIANQLVSKYPNIIYDIVNGSIDKNTFDTKDIKGMGKARWEKLYDCVMDNYVISDIITLLQPLGVSFKMIQRLIDDQPSPYLLKQELLDNPYVITKIHGIGFHKADDIALKLNPDMRISNERLVAFITYHLKEAAENDGHTWCSLASLKIAISNTMPECLDLLDPIIDNNSFLHIESIDGKKRIGLQYLFDMEKNIFIDLINREKYQHCKEDNRFNFSDDDIQKAIDDSEKEQGFKYTDEQRNTIILALSHNVAVISGVAGAGKSTIARAILKAYHNKKLRISTMAMSAKAAQRIAETTGLTASTIHRGLGAKGLNEFSYNKECKMPIDIVFVDESSMINARMYWHLLCAMKEDTRLILMGDALQLPPIGAGNVFLDILSNKSFCTFKLTKPLRQAQSSGILVDANQIRNGVNPLKKPELSIVHGDLRDMHYKFRGDRDLLNKIAIKIYMKSVAKDGVDNCVLLTPRKSGCINSSYEINQVIQELIIDDKSKFIESKFNKFYNGSKVIQVVNNYEKGIFNGEIGKVIDIDIYFDKSQQKKIATVEYPDTINNTSKYIEYYEEELNELELAYALTVHKYQGSEAKTVIGIIDNSHYVLLDSCLLYTMITRAKGRCMIVAEPNAFNKSVKTNHNTSRRTWLRGFSINDDGSVNSKYIPFE